MKEWLEFNRSFVIYSLFELEWPINSIKRNFKVSLRIPLSEKLSELVLLLKVVDSLKILLSISRYPVLLVIYAILCYASVHRMMRLFIELTRKAVFLIFNNFGDFSVELGGRHIMVVFRSDYFKAFKTEVQTFFSRVFRAHLVMSLLRRSLSFPLSSGTLFEELFVYKRVM